MNKININKKEQPNNFHVGDLFQDNMGGVYLLTNKCSGWRAWSLLDGNVWRANPNYNTPEAAVEGLKFLGRNLNITIE